MSAQQTPPHNIDRYVVTHVATTCDEHGVYVTKDSAEVIELGWILLDAKSLEEVRWHIPSSLLASSGLPSRQSEPPLLTMPSALIGRS
ncbi:hypothetical protein IMZ48_13885 [Candidatus Bathyarchaeota archaeon]|nr:hypothetical protein [Candidatus Bathyarchaeota archaeon]